MRTGFQIRLHIMLVALVSASWSVAAAPNETDDWIKIGSDNYTLVGDMGEAKSTELLRQLEVFRQAALKIASVERDADSIPTIIYAIEDESTLRKLGFADESPGIVDSGLRQNLVVLTSHELGPESQEILHEFVHFLIRKTHSAWYPLWYDEGFADYLSAIRFTGDQLTVGNVPERHLEWLEYGRWLYVNKVVFPNNFYNWGGHEVQMFRAQSWATVHFLMNRSKPGVYLSHDMDLYIQRVRDGNGRRVAFQEAFDLSTIGINKQLRRYLRVGDFSAFVLDVSDVLPFFSIEVEKLEAHETALMIASLATHLGKDDIAISLLERHADVFAKNAPALSLYSRLLSARDETLAAFTKIQKARSISPYDPWIQADWANFLLERARRKDGSMQDARDAYEAVWALDKTIPETYVKYAMTLENDDAQRSNRIAMLERAQSLLPSSTHIRLLLIDAYLDNGLYEEAGRIQRSQCAASRRMNKSGWVKWLCER